MKALSDIIASGFSSNASAFAGGGGGLPQHDTTPAEALAQELSGNGYVNAVNTFLGEGAGSLAPVGTSGVVNGGRNVAIGFRAGEANTSGWQNTGVGFISLLKTTTGIYNSALGAYTLVENTTGSNNTGIGADALWLNTTGSDNTGVGSYALQQNTTPNANSAFGKEAMRYNTTGSGNSVFGARAMRGNTGTFTLNTGVDNVAFGLEAMFRNENGTNNAALGARALWKNTSGSENMAIGGYTLFENTTGARNIAIGFAALGKVVTGSRNVAIGYFSGDLTTGNDNTYIGNEAGKTVTSGARNILIGHGIQASSATASDEINIGGVYKGSRSTSIAELANALKLPSISDPAAPTGGALLYSQSLAGRHLPLVRAPVGIVQALQGALHGNSVFMLGVASGTTAPTVYGGTLTTAATMSMVQTIASANPWQAAQRKRFASAATAGSVTGCRTAYVQWFRGNAAGFGGFFFRAQFGQNINLNGAQCFVGLCASTGALATTAGAVGALVNMIGVGYDTTDASTGNWQLFRNDGSGTATKVDLGATNAARNTTHGYDLIIFCPPGAATEIWVRIVNLHSGAIVLDTSYTTDLPAVNVGMAMKAECNNGAVASACNLELAKVYIESDN